MRSRAQGFLAYATILATCIAGMLHFSWWAFLAGACSLALISISNHPIAQRALVGSEAPTATLMASSLLNAGATAAGALIAGRLIGAFWGV